MRALMLALVVATALPVVACQKQEDEGARVLPTPARKPGMWRQVTTVEGLGAAPPMDMCLDKATDNKLAWWAQQGVRGGCARNDIKQNADGSWTFASVCEAPGGIKTITEGTATGDFQSSYKVSAVSTTTGAPNLEMNGKRNVTIESTWVGECTGDMRPGDIRLPDGNLLNVVELSGG
ncbi:MAG TPA: DUF3617 family protein [Caulobacteraceae bacterium]